MRTVWIYVDTNYYIGHADHLKVFATGVADTRDAPSAKRDCHRSGWRAAGNTWKTGSVEISPSANSHGPST